MEELIAQYTGADEDSRLTRQYIAQIEFDTTMHCLQSYLVRGARVCELGAATGRYSLSFAKMGCDVTAVELAPEQVDILRRKAQQENLDVAVYQGNACDIPFLENESQDVCVILGPLYHLKSQLERERAIIEAKRILKPGGILAVAYISRFFVAGMFAQKFPELVTSEILSELTTSGTVSNQAAPSFFKVGYFATPFEIEKLVSKAQFDLLNHVATDGFGRYISTSVNTFTSEQYQTWLTHHLEVCNEPSLLGSSNHGLVVAVKG
ncbi:class I SAM-dependent methyltransferase [Vibrio europaeus]|uniref:class I SAM-dependent methyltransferase n=1 Tax=Vibrio europaeus TaxID=300876 RepID=UPI0018A755DB|nr:class I SAM-dependent methyltransferase [Vibrio europaeus]MDC5806510.1 class I SAM-dependent methyltransferase [Vibrio europaeus]MDC5812813.1 class I SAM-dependent methyltransferase [Vibrio europaeus]MDC5824125.1 class I SAM-dependent methyltransferase [Vibrio europaeus]MDC5829880.1 class I SAM-dependent methyltransferase [Vibrio europaeus]MDC5836735.1 class I SAM-dependent methyltransferase [Vibrio europaeus]